MPSSCRSPGVSLVNRDTGGAAIALGGDGRLVNDDRLDVDSAFERVRFGSNDLGV